MSGLGAIFIIAAFAVLLCVIDGIAKLLPPLWRWFYDWLWDVVTFYYKFKAYRRRKKNV